MSLPPHDTPDAAMPACSGRVSGRSRETQIGPAQGPADYDYELQITDYEFPPPAHVLLGGWGNFGFSIFNLEWVGGNSLLTRDGDGAVDGLERHLGAAGTDRPPHARPDVPALVDLDAEIVAKVPVDGLREQIDAGARREVEVDGAVDRLDGDLVTGPRSVEGHLGGAVDRLDGDRAGQVTGVDAAVDALHLDAAEDAADGQARR